jgi:hypothetical protein
MAKLLECPIDCERYYTMMLLSSILSEQASAQATQLLDVKKLKILSHGAVQLLGIF